MKKKSLSLILLSLLLTMVLIQIASSHNAPFPPNYDPTHLVIDSISEPESLDPAWAYDTGSTAIIINVYETLVFFARDYTLGPYKTGLVNQFEPKLAIAWNIEHLSPPGVDPVTGVVWHWRFSFTVRGTWAPPVLAIPNVNLGKPVCTHWDGDPIPNAPSLSRDYHLEEWIDNGDGVLGYCDTIVMHYYCGNAFSAGWVKVYFHVIEVWYDGIAGLYKMLVEPVPVYFHDGSVLKTEDAEYSFERLLVQDRDGGPQWMTYEPLLHEYCAIDPSTDPNWGIKIDHAVQGVDSNGDGVKETLVFNLTKDVYPSLVFMQILSQTWSSVVNKEWCIAHGDLDVNSVIGDWSNWQDIWNKWHNPSVSFIEGDMMGTGPYKFDYWIPGIAWSIIRFEKYWDGWPARVGPCTTKRLGGYISRATTNKLLAWTTRRARFLAGDSDMTDVKKIYQNEVLDQRGVRCFYPLKVWALDAFFFTFDINPASPYVGVLQPPGTFSENGIPPDIFSDVNVRRGLAYAFNYAWYIATAYQGEGQQLATYHKPYLQYHNPSQAAFFYSLVLADYYLKLAWGGVDNAPTGPPWGPEDVPGALWMNGMTFTIVYASGNVAREIAAQDMANNINSLNPKFHITITGLQWATFLQQMQAGLLPLFVSGWTVDFTDPHDFAHPFMHSQGTFASIQRYSNPHVDDLIEAGIQTPDDVTPYAAQLDLPDPRPFMVPGPPNIPPDSTWPRRSIYYELQAIYHEEVPSFPIGEPIARHFERDWVRGWYFNPLYGGSHASEIDSVAPEAPVNYIYHLWKALTHFGDLNNDGAVNILDMALVSAHWYPGPPIGPSGYSPIADVNGGKGCAHGDIVPGIPDGRVDIVDAALVSAYWDGPPQGPSHP